ncbi:MAG TPA: class I SAM-dependent methyltransferase [Jatrophihabitans sp.]
MAWESVRAEVMRRGIMPGRSSVLEIGPLDRPVLGKSAYDVRYADFTDSATLRAKYADDPGVGAIVDVDVIWDGASPLREVLGEAHLDAVVASHVIEHLPDPVGWLANFAGVLTPGGLVNLVIPDKRVTFDVNRRLTEAADWIDASLRRPSQPTYAQIFDFHTKALPDADTVGLWAGTVDYRGVVRDEGLAAAALEACRGVSEDGPHADVHCSVFTPTSFVDIVEQLGELELLDYALAELVPTKPNTIEFYARLMRLDPASDPAQRRQKRDDGIAAAREAIAAAPAPISASGSDDDGPSAAHYVVSEREQRFVELKRRVMRRFRTWRARR